VTDPTASGWQSSCLCRSCLWWERAVVNIASCGRRRRCGSCRRHRQMGTAPHPRKEGARSKEAALARLALRNFPTVEISNDCDVSRPTLLVTQADKLIEVSSTAPLTELMNFTPWMIFGNWLWPSGLRQFFCAPSTSLKTMGSAVLFERHVRQRMPVLIPVSLADRCQMPTLTTHADAKANGTRCRDAIWRLDLAADVASWVMSDN
jgi:hypothetical protein